MKPAIKKNEAGTPELYLYDEIGPWWDAISAQSVLDTLESIGDVPELVVRINSPGGEVFDGVAIYQALARHKAKIRVEIDALAASIASVIAMAGDEIVIAGNALIMVHRAWTMAWGNAEEIGRVVASLQAVDAAILDTYDARTGQASARADIQAWVAGETWMGAEEAVSRGFATRAGELKSDVVPALVPEGRYQHVPKGLTTKADTHRYARPTWSSGNPVHTGQAERACRELPAIAAKLGAIRERYGR